MRRFKDTTSRHRPDITLLVCLGLLTIIGLFALTSAGAAVGYQKFGDSYFFIKHQILYGLLPGLVLFAIFFSVNYQFWKKFTLPFLALSILLLITVFIPGLGAKFGTARSWIDLGGFSLQPSEIVKLTFMLYLATWLAKRGEHGVKDLYYGFMPFLFLIGIISVLMLLQPDTGSLAIIIFMSVAVFFASGAKAKHVLGLFAAGAFGFYLLLKSSTYRAARFQTFLHPELDLQGRGYHINQAFMAIGSGGFWGRGFGNSQQKFNYLPEPTGDSIFAIMSEELGFVLCFLIVSLFVMILWRSFKIAKNVNDPFGRLLAIGISSWFIFQAFFNISSMIGLLPMTGVPLPFISYGGTALAMNLAGAGILLNISRQTKI
ncbi:MAG: putative lipid II flippase FtsW [Parcubacteria group bacterium]